MKFCGAILSMPLPSSFMHHCCSLPNLDAEKIQFRICLKVTIFPDVWLRQQKKTAQLKFKIISSELVMRKKSL